MGEALARFRFGEVTELSISQVRTFLEKSGCALFATIIIGVALIIGMTAFPGCNDPRMARDFEQNELVAEVAGSKILARDIRNVADQQFFQFRMQGMEVPPTFEVQILAGALDQLIESAVLYKLAQDRGVGFRDEDIQTYFSRIIDEQTVLERQRLVAEGKLEADHTEGDFLRVLREENPGFTNFDDLRRQQAEEIRNVLSDPDRREMLIRGVAGPMLAQIEEARVNVTEEDARRNYDTLVLKRVFVRSLPDEDSRIQVERIRADILSGVTTFEAAMDNFSTDAPPTPSQRVSEGEQKYGLSMIANDEKLAPLAALSEGEISEPIEEFGGWAIYRLERVERALPDDFEQRIDHYVRQAKSAQAVSNITLAARELREKTVIDWKSDGYRVLHEYNRMGMDPEIMSAPARRKEKLEEYFAMAEDAMMEDFAGQDVAALLRYVIFEELYMLLPPDEQAEALDRRIEYARDIPDFIDRPSIQLAIVDWLRQAQRYDDALSALLEAAESNVDTGTAGENTHEQIQNRLELILEHSVDESIVARIREEMARWEADYAEAKAEEERMRRELEEEQRRWDEELGESDPEPATPRPGSSEDN